jgi:hypothetical protein
VDPAGSLNFRRPAPAAYVHFRISGPGVSLIEFATTLLSLNYWKQCPLSGGQFGTPYFRSRCSRAGQTDKSIFTAE